MRQWGRRLGAAGLLGLALLVLALGLFFILVQPLHNQSQQTSSSSISYACCANRRCRAHSGYARSARHAAARQFGGGTLGELEQLARAHGFELTRGQYSVAAVNGAPE